MIRSARHLHVLCLLAIFLAMATGPGVAQDGTAHCVVATWNADRALDEARLLAPYRAILHLLARDAG
jgi:hypothetical protein